MRSFIRWCQAHALALGEGVQRWCHHRVMGGLGALLVGGVLALGLMSHVCQPIRDAARHAWGSQDATIVYLKPFVPAFEGALVQRTLLSDAAVASATLVTPEAGLVRMANRLHMASILKAEGDNPLPTVLMVTPRWDVSTQGWHEAVARWTKLDKVERVAVDWGWYGQWQAVARWSERTQAISGLVGALAVGLYVLLAVSWTWQRAEDDVRVAWQLGVPMRDILRPWLYLGCVHAWLALWVGLLLWSLGARALQEHMGPLVVGWVPEATWKTMWLATYPMGWVAAGVTFVAWLVGRLTLRRLSMPYRAPQQPA